MFAHDSCYRWPCSNRLFYRSQMNIHYRIKHTLDSSTYIQNAVFLQIGSETFSYMGSIGHDNHISQLTYRILKGLLKSLKIFLFDKLHKDRSTSSLSFYTNNGYRSGEQHKSNQIYYYSSPKVWFLAKPSLTLSNERFCW